MRTLALLTAAAVLGGTAVAVAETPYSCRPSTTTRVRMTPDKAKVRIKTVLNEPAGFDPAADGLSIELSYEPETDPSNLILAATLPAAGFKPIVDGWRYADSTGAVNGIVRVVLRGQPGARKTKIVRKGTPLPVSADTRNVRVAVVSGAGCTRSCTAACRVSKGRLSCRGEADWLPACGIRSGCDLLAAPDFADAPHGRCVLPYPSDFFTVDDPSTPTGKRMAYDPQVLPVNKDGVHIDGAPYDTLDGFSPGSMMLANFPNGVDLALSAVPPLTNLSASLDPGSPTVLIEADSPGCVRVPHFGENDVSIGVSGQVAPPDQLFIVRPAVRLENGKRYIVALRSLVDQLGAPIPAPFAFQIIRDGSVASLGSYESRRPHVESVLDKLEDDCAIPRASLTLAWDFTVASDDAIQRWLLHMRDTAFTQLGAGNAPAFTVDNVEEPPLLNNSGTQPDPRICRRVTGTFTAPLFTTFDGPGSVLNLDPMGSLPMQNGTTQVPYTAVVPCSVLNTLTPGRPIYYGHGLLGSRGEVTAGNLRELANTYGFVLAAVDWQGFSNADTVTVLQFLPDLSGFRKMPERSHQGMLNQLLLARLMVASNGFPGHAAFQGPLAEPLIDTTEAYYYGNSQGGILGPVVMAASQETTRGILGVPGANYSLLLQRSLDFDPFFALLRINYPDDANRMLLYPLLQQLWDRAEANGWYHKIIPGGAGGAPPHEVILHMARGDDEVSNIATQIMARSMGIPQIDLPIQSYFGIPVVAAPYAGSILVESDFGVPPIPLTNIPPADNSVHGAMRGLVPIQQQIDQFLQPGGTVQQFCSGGICDPD